MKRILTIDIGGSYIKYGQIQEDLTISNKGRKATPDSSLEDFLSVLSSINSTLSAPSTLALEQDLTYRLRLVTFFY